MVITYYGLSCFKIQSGKLTIVTDPFGAGLGITPPRFQTDMALISHPHVHHSYTENLKPRLRTDASDGQARLSDTIFIINGPGEYEYESIRVWGFKTFHDQKGGASHGPNTIYIIEVEDITLAHMGDFGEAKIPSHILNNIENIDILFMPVGGGATLDARRAHEIVQEFEPKIVIPMHYKLKGMDLKLNDPGAFLKEMGSATIKPIDKLTVKRGDLKKSEEKSTTSVVLLQAGSENI